MDLQAVCVTAEHIARQAGAVLMQHFDQPHRETTKKTAIDIVTEGDTASEALIIPALRAAFPNHGIVSEEGGGSHPDAEYCWYIDPLDGTSNYANNIPFFSVSMALADRHKRPLVGVVYQPSTGDLYSAALDHGATANGQPLVVSTTDTLEQSMLCSGFPYDSHTNPDNNLAQWAAFTRRARGLRRFGSVALELGFVAGGRFEGLWEKQLNPWDVLAGILLVQEAGGHVTDYRGDDSDLVYTGRQILATNGRVHEAMMAVLAESTTQQPSF
jgi:myo-inositol-1(or 4)-monophosphatase